MQLSYEEILKHRLRAILYYLELNELYTEAMHFQCCLEELDEVLDRIEAGWTRKEAWYPVYHRLHEEDRDW